MRVTQWGQMQGLIYNEPPPPPPPKVDKWNCTLTFHLCWGPQKKKIINETADSHFVPWVPGSLSAACVAARLCAVSRVTGSCCGAPAPGCGPRSPCGRTRAGESARPVRAAWTGARWRRPDCSSRWWGSWSDWPAPQVGFPNTAQK